MESEDGAKNSIPDKAVLKKSPNGRPLDLSNNNANENSNDEGHGNNNSQESDNGEVICSQNISSGDHGTTSYISMTYNLNVFQSQRARDDKQHYALRNNTVKASRTCMNCSKNDEITTSDDVTRDSKSDINCVVSDSAPKLNMSVKCAFRVHKSSNNFDKEIDSNTFSALQDAVQAVKKVPFADPEEVKNLLENNSVKSNTSLQASKSEVIKSSPISESSSEEQLTESDTVTISDDSRKCDENDLNDSVEQQLMHDVREICKIFPNKDQYEIYAYLEAHVHKPDRKQIVVDELLGMWHCSQNSSLRSSPVEALVPSCKTPHRIIALQSLQSIFPNVDPDVLDSILKSHELSNERNQSLIDDLEQMSAFPKLQEALMCKLQRTTLKMCASERFLITAFLELFDSPEEYFYDESTPVTEAYKKHALASLYDLFPHVSHSHVDTVLSNHRFHYTPALRQLEYELGIQKPNLHEKPKRMKINESPENMMEPDETFNKERLFTELEDEMLEYRRGKEECRVARIEEARINNELLTCMNCFDDDLLITDVGACAQTHLTCKDCIRKEAEEKLASGNGIICCLTCNNPYELSILEKVLKPSMFSLVLHNKHKNNVQSPNASDSSIKNQLPKVSNCNSETVRKNENAVKVKSRKSKSESRKIEFKIL